ncbi:hypothetical protein [Dictyobacter arantiisoli]|uniref:Uncharacterized protein n=1 Tax=Dictyobacter arantiisoli TaxID=2014874 RepID=A0A5A5T5K0_9CHLR|nr:hypothetical protein [Dictyobacter arantiisoli]GCF06475.1 hypothetical protein KDI_00390 [Dictyobacter arantiisoli]
MTITSETEPPPLAERIASVRQHMLSEATTCMISLEIEKCTDSDQQHTCDEASKFLNISHGVSSSFSPYQAWLFSPFIRAQLRKLAAVYKIDLRQTNQGLFGWDDGWTDAEK